MARAHPSAAGRDNRVAPHGARIVVREDQDPARAEPDELTGDSLDHGLVERREPELAARRNTVTAALFSELVVYVRAVRRVGEHEAARFRW